MSYTFRTIEDFVRLLDDRSARRNQLAEEQPLTSCSRRVNREAAQVYESIAEIVRNSNLGIVFSYSEDDCPSHVSASQKICCNCGIHIDSLRPPDVP